MRNSGSDFTVEYLRQKLDAVYCHERGTSVELSANSDKHYPMILFKKNRRVQAIIWFCDRMLDDTKLKNMRRQGSKVHEEMLLHNCRVVYVFTRKKPQNINYEYWAFNCVWVFDYNDYKELSYDRIGCLLFPHNLYIYNTSLKQYVTDGLNDTAQQRAGVVLPTGWGKTYLMARIIFDHPNCKALIVCPTKLIRDQFRAVLQPFKERVTIMTYQALLIKHNNDQNEEAVPEECLRDVEIALFDEIHHSLGEEYRKAVNHFMSYYNPKIAIGFTATPMGGKSREQNSIDAHFDKNVRVQVSFNKAWEYNLLPTPSVICPTSKRLLGEHDWNPVIRSEKALPNNISSSNIQLSDAAMEQMVDSLKCGKIKHVLYFIDVWRKSNEAEQLMKRALDQAGYQSSEYRFWTLRGDEDSDREQQATKLAYEKEPVDGVKVHVLIGAVMIKEGYHPKCRVDMAIIGFTNNSENMIIQMIGRTQFVQSGLVDEKEPYQPVIVDFMNATSIFRKEADYIDLSGRAPSIHKQKDGGGGRGKHGPVTLISGATVLSGEDALMNINKTPILSWDIMRDSLEEFFDSTHSVPGECDGYLNQVGRHSEKNQRFFDYYSQILLNPESEFHKNLTDWLKAKRQVFALQWIAPDFPKNLCIDSLEDFFSISGLLEDRVDFYDRRIQSNEATFGFAMVRHIQVFIDRLGALIQQKVFPLFKERYGVWPSLDMAGADDQLKGLLHCCAFIASVPNTYYMGIVDQQAFELHENPFAADWYRVLRAIELNTGVKQAMGQFMGHFNVFQTNEQLGKKRREFLDSLEIGFKSPKDASDELIRIARNIERFLSVEPRSDTYYRCLTAIYTKLFKQTLNIPLYLQLLGNRLMAKQGTYIRVLGCIQQNPEAYFNCYGTKDGLLNELRTQYAEMWERQTMASDRRNISMLLKEEIAYMIGKDPADIELDMFMKRIKNG